MGAQVNRNLANFATRVAAAIEAVGDCEGPLDFYVERVTFGFEGETDTSVTVVPDEFGGYCIEAGGA